MHNMFAAASEASSAASSAQHAIVASKVGGAGGTSEQTGGRPDHGWYGENGYREKIAGDLRRTTWERSGTPSPNGESATVTAPALM